MNTWNWILAAVNFGCGLILIGLSIPLLRGRIPMNYFYGMRLSQSFKSDAHWYLVNRYGARQLILWSIPLLVVGLLALFVRFEDDDLKLILPFLLAPTVAPLASCFVTMRYARTLPAHIAKDSSPQ